jgi:hypothetical protein
MAMKGFLTMVLTAAVGGGAMLGALSASPGALCERPEAGEARIRVALPEPGLVYREHQAQLRNLRASVVPANFVTFVSTEDDDVDAGVLLKNPADYESHTVARMMGVPVPSAVLSVNELRAQSGEPICEVVKN